MYFMCIWFHVNAVNFIDMHHARYIVLCSWHVCRENISLYTYENKKDTYALVFRMFTKQKRPL